MRRQITPQEVIDAADDALRHSQYFSMPGIVKAFHAGGPGRAATVDVQPAVHDVRFDLDTEARVSEPWEVLLAVPVAWPKFAGFIISGPLKVGDHVLLRAFDHDPSEHLASGQPEDPAFVRRHGGNFWYAIPADVTDAGAPQDSAAAGDALVIGVDGGQAQIRIQGSTIQVGAGASDFVALASKVTQALKDLAQWVQTGQYVNSGGSPTPVTYATPYNPDSVAAEVAKAQ